MSVKILVVADSHGSRDNLQTIIDREWPFSHLIHCGDGVDDLGRISLSGPVEILSVSGNMDRRSRNSPARLIETELSNVRFLICHGDQFAAHHDYERLLHEGLCRGVDIICCGHTHIPCYHNSPPLLFNPGPADRGLYGVISLGLQPGDLSCEHRQVQAGSSVSQ